MSSTTLLVSLEGIAIGGVTELVQARGIDRVIVVASGTQFNDFATTSTLNSVVAIKNAGAKIELALNTGSTLSITDTAANVINTNGFTFIDEPSLQSLSGSLLASNGLIQSQGTDAILPILDSSSTTSELTLDGSVVLASDAGSALTVTTTHSGTSPNYLTDFGGTVRVNLTANEFADLVTNNPSKFSTVKEQSNINVALPTVAPQAPNDKLIDGSGAYILDPANVPSAGKVSFGNLEGVNPNQTTPQEKWENVYYWKETATLNTLQALSLPKQGVIPGFDETRPTEENGFTTGVTLADSAQNLIAALPQLTEGQLSSFTKIIVNDNAPLTIDANTFKKLDTTATTPIFTTHLGTNIQNANNSPLLINLTSDIDSLTSAGLLLNGQIVSKISGSTGDNLIDSINTITLNNVVASDIPTLKTLSAQSDNTLATLEINFTDYSVSVAEFKDLVALDVTAANKVSISDTEANLKSLLLTATESQIAAFAFVSGFISSTGPASIDLTWNQYLDLTGGVFSANVFSNLIDVELSVSGTASELQTLFSNFGTSFENLANSVSFTVTDGGEVQLNESQADKLDGRFNGSI